MAEDRQFFATRSAGSPRSCRSSVPKSIGLEAVGAGKVSSDAFLGFALGLRAISTAP